MPPALPWTCATHARRQDGAMRTHGTGVRLDYVSNGQPVQRQPGRCGATTCGNGVESSLTSFILYTAPIMQRIGLLGADYASDETTLRKFGGKVRRESSAGKFDGKVRRESLAG